MSESLQTDIKAVAQITAIPVLLDIICRTTGLGFAAVARVTGSQWIACALRDDIGFGLQPPGELKLETTLCREVRESLQSRVVESADNHFPPFAAYGVASYISVPILREDGSFFGTLCAFDKLRRPLQNADTLAMFETFAALIGSGLSAIDRQAKLEADLLPDLKTSDLRDQLIAVLGHDLRNPLTAILGGMEMLQRNPLNDRASQWADMVVASATRMAEMIDVVMDFSRCRLSGGLPLDCTACDAVEPALRRQVEEMRAAKPGRRIEDRYCLAAPVFCDLPRIGQLAGNLLRNAANFGDADQPIRLEAATKDGAFELTVSHAGEPIPPALLQTIFEPLSHGSVQPSREGLGLGLYISHQIALAHGGTLDVASTPEETRFTFRMPAAPPV